MSAATVAVLAAELALPSAGIAAALELGKLTPTLQARLAACTLKAEIEDLYLPFKPKRRTRASVARERGLEPLALRILAQPLQGDPVAEARRHVGGEVADVEAALAGARDIAAEVVCERAEVRASLRDLAWRHGVVLAQVVPKRKAEADRFVRDPAEVVHAGQKLRVKVVEVDLARRRLKLSAKPTDVAAGAPATSLVRR